MKAGDLRQVKRYGAMLYHTRSRWMTLPGEVQRRTEVGQLDADEPIVLLEDGDGVPDLETVFVLTRLGVGFVRLLDVSVARVL